MTRVEELPDVPQQVDQPDAEDQHHAARLRVGELHRPLEVLRRPVEEVELRRDVVGDRRLGPAGHRMRVGKPLLRLHARIVSHR